MYIFYKILIFFYLSHQVIAEEFVYGLGDVPIFKDMRSIEDSYILFDKVDGRYLYSEIKGEYAILEIQEYYEKVLPNLGWKLHKKNSFLRGEEILEIQYLIDNRETKVVFTISPKK
tara:strand:+ start:440 stop:787 length:348 start_codon:yes stop_codon:yes gene_type:complete